MRVRFAITIAVGVALILAGAVETNIHHRTQHRVSLIQKASVSNFTLLSR